MGSRVWSLSALNQGPDAAIVLVGGGSERAKVAQALSSLTSRPVVSVGEASKLAGVLQGMSALGSKDEE